MLFALEGLDGSGKSTMSKMFFQTLVEHGQQVILTREPGATGVGVKIRELLLSGIEMSPVTEYLLFAADRSEHLIHIDQQLKSGWDVVTDRFFGSSVIYQGAKGVDHNFMREVFFNSGGFFPDLTFFMDVSYEKSQERMEKRQKDHFEAADRDEFNRRREIGLFYVDTHGWVRIDADQAPEDCLAEMVRAIIESDYTNYAQEVFGG